MTASPRDWRCVCGMNPCRRTRKPGNCKHRRKVEMYDSGGWGACCHACGMVWGTQRTRTFPARKCMGMGRTAVVLLLCCIAMPACLKPLPEKPREGRLTREQADAVIYRLGTSSFDVYEFHLSDGTRCVLATQSIGGSSPGGIFCFEGGAP